MSTDDLVIEQAEDGVLSPEQAAAFLARLEAGDTGALSSEEGAAPNGTPEQVTQAEEPQAGAAAGEAAAVEPEPVVLAKDNQNTIPYKVLQDEREGKAHWKATAEAALAELEQLKQQADQRQEAGQAATATDVNATIAIEAIAAGVDPAIFGDMDEAGLAKGVLLLSQQLIQQTEQRFTQRIAELEAKLAPVEQRAIEDANAAHYEAIRAKHPDFAEVVESKELQDWVNAQPSFARDQYNLVIEKGTAAQAIELLDTFKASTGRNQTAGSPSQDAKALAKAAISQAQVEPPTSLSAVAGGRAGPSTAADALANLTGMELVAAIERLPDDQRQAFLDGRL